MFVKIKDGSLETVFDCSRYQYVPDMSEIEDLTKGTIIIHFDRGIGDHSYSIDCKTKVVKVYIMNNDGKTIDRMIFDGKQIIHK